MAAQGRTDVGLRREHNEDALLVSPGLCAVADGLGGHAAGEVASALVVDVLAALAPHPPVASLEAAVLGAHHAIRARAGGDPTLRGMGSTVVALALSDEGPVLLWVGDSRGYLLSGEGLTPLSRDDSLVADDVDAGLLTAEQARTDRRRNVVTQALGLSQTPTVHVLALPEVHSTRLLLCSDGLTEHVTDAEIAAVLTEQTDRGSAADRLVALAREGGGSDNITVVVIDLTPA